MLSSLINEDFNVYYDWNSMKVNYELLKERLISLKKKYGYSKDFIEILKKCLRKDELQRLSSTELVETLQTKGYRDQRDSIGTLRLNSPVPKRGSQAELSTFDFDTKTKVGLLEYVNSSGQGSGYGFSNRVLDSMDSSGQRFNSHHFGAQSPIMHRSGAGIAPPPQVRSFDHPQNRSPLGQRMPPPGQQGAVMAGPGQNGRRFNSPLGKIAFGGRKESSPALMGGLHPLPQVVDLRGSGYRAQQPQILVNPNGAPAYLTSRENSRDIPRRGPGRSPLHGGFKQQRGVLSPANLSPTVGIRGSALRRSNHQNQNLPPQRYPGSERKPQRRPPVIGSSPRVSFLIKFGD